MNEIIRQIDELQDKIFAQDLKTVPEGVTSLLATLVEQRGIDLQSIDSITKFNRLMEMSLQAMTNRDYLLLADLLEFRLKPMLPETKGGLDQ
jgi:hypothetical protein